MILVLWLVPAAVLAGLFGKVFLFEIGVGFDKAEK